jgi:SAM-dependent methyltransferase
MANSSDKTSLVAAEFKLFFLILSQESIFNEIPLKMKEETKFHEENISDKFYNDYKCFKVAIYKNLVENNSLYDKLTLFKKSQKLLDRILFILFAEDCGLCPPNTIYKTIDRWKIFKTNDVDFSLYSLFQKLFGYLNNGKKFDDYEYPSYNGGLFKFDDILDHDKTCIDDTILFEHCPRLSAYDFNTDIDVNILGHIFEHSLNEIEKISVDIENQNNGFSVNNEISFSKEKNSLIQNKISKRKKDGIFYTPKFITNYIVENTIGKLCKNKQIELQIYNTEVNEIFSKNGKITKQGKELYKQLQDYKNWLLTLKILDPACGSGAFLNAALDFLIAEHKQVADLMCDLTGDKIRLFDIDKTILENNIFGVDINEESVEIAKLSLWLRTARKDRKLSDLNDNIKCGNSLIDNPEIAGEKAFNWNKEFQQIFGNENNEIEVIDIKKLDKKTDYLKLIKEKTLEAKDKAEKAKELSNQAIELTQKVYEYAEKLETIKEPSTEYKSKNVGFDVVIGNPPYVRQENIKKSEKDYLSKHFTVGSGTADLYVYFYNLGINLLKKNGILGFITPNKWFKTKYGLNLRNFLKEYQIIEIYDFFELKIFQDASTEPQIIIVKNQKSDQSFNYYPVSSTTEFITSQIKPNPIDKIKLNADSWILGKNDNETVLKKIYDNSISLIEYTKNGIEYGIKTGLNKAFIIDEKTKNELIKEDPKSMDLIKKYVSATNIGKWSLNTIEKQYFINTYYDIDISTYPAIYKHLLKFNDELEKRQDKGQTHFNLRSCNYYDKFETSKIIYIRTAIKHNFYLDNENYFINDSCYIISNADKFLACWLNSSIFNFLKRLIFVAYGDSTEKGRAKLDYNKMINIPIPKLTEYQKQPFFEKADKMLSVSKELQTKIEKFIKRIKSNFVNINITTKLSNFYDYDFKIFVSEIKKQKIEFNLKQQDEWEEYFESYKMEINDLLLEINRTDKEINKMIYKLYDFKTEEIALVEGDK